MHMYVYISMHIRINNVSSVGVLLGNLSSEPEAPREFEAPRPTGM